MDFIERCADAMTARKVASHNRCAYLLKLQTQLTINHRPACGIDGLDMSAEEHVPHGSIMVMITCRSGEHETFEIISLNGSVSSGLRLASSLSPVRHCLRFEIDGYHGEHEKDRNEQKKDHDQQR